ncbi:MAG: hypothetical protein F6K37_17940, partial [Moorea sp. SIO4E2]|uniref:hypothetical protein n=1 Tax=Moorena sp. SIO4E2 TaxID=2607826 RepID=UPI0013B60046
ISRFAQKQALLRTPALSNAIASCGKSSKKSPEELGITGYGVRYKGAYSIRVDKYIQTLIPVDWIVPTRLG